MKLIPKNWRTFQHYGNRRPPWIKLHRELLDDKDFMCLPLASKAIAPLLWLLASESKNGEFNADIDDLSFRLRIPQKEVDQGLKPLIDNGFFIDASTMLAPCYQVATTEREGERETERDKPLARPDDISEELWKDFKQLRSKKKAPITDRVLKTIRNEAAKIGMTLSQAIELMIVRGWTGFDSTWVKDKPKTSAMPAWAKTAFEAKKSGG
jgi:hypothetical protein